MEEEERGQQLHVGPLGGLRMAERLLILRRRRLSAREQAAHVLHLFFFFFIFEIWGARAPLTLTHTRTQ